MPALLQAADLVMTMGGYNALMEALRAGPPILAMPRLGPSAEQQTRADLFERLGLLRTVSPTADTAELAAHVVRALHSPGPPRRLLDTGGLRRAANRLAQLLDATAQPGVPGDPINCKAAPRAATPRAAAAHGEA